MEMWPELDTPALRIDLEKLDRNLEEMASAARSHGLHLRPHTKTHKAVRIAKRQLDLGAVGVTCAKLGEAEVYARAGIRDIFICFPLVGSHKLRRLRNLTREANMMTIVESEAGARGLSEVMAGEGRELDVLLDLEVGYGRVGVLEEQAADLAALVGKLPGIRLKGVCIHEGSTYAQPEAEGRAAVVESHVTRMLAVAEELRIQGHQIDIISCGSTPGARAALEVGGITEIRPGNYCFYDAMQVGLGVVPEERCALSVLATVVSCSEAGRGAIDAGAKSLSLDKGLGVAAVSHGIVRNRPNIVIERLSEEHGWLRTMDGEEIQIGERVDVIPNHACVVANLFNEYAVTKGGKVLERWPVDARGMVA
jgi:D-serine deaminase-like pyridoxal phosphate-dependent protein